MLGALLMDAEILHDGVENFLGAAVPGLEDQPLEAFITEVVSMRVFSQLGSANRMEIERNKSRCFFILKIHDDIQDLDYIKECNITIFIHVSGKIHTGLGFSRIQNNIHRN